MKQNAEQGRRRSEISGGVVVILALIFVWATLLGWPRLDQLFK